MTQQEARLYDSNWTTEIGRCTVPAFPFPPTVVRIPDGRVFMGGEIGYGVDFLSYHRQDIAYSAKDFVASPVKEGE